jgi:hypothetical protein
MVRCCFVRRNVLVGILLFLQVNKSYFVFVKGLTKPCARYIIRLLNIYKRVWNYELYVLRNGI